MADAVARFRERQRMWEERAAAIARGDERFARRNAEQRREAQRVKRSMARAAARAEAEAKAEAERRMRFEEEAEFAAERDYRRWFEACRKRYRNLITSAGIANTIDRRGPDDCWEWMGARNSLDYGVVSWIWPSGKFQRQALAHRVALGLVLGREPVQMVLHSCDNPPCVNPAHLREGTAKENAQDAVSRNRWTLPNQESADLIRHLHSVGHCSAKSGGAPSSRSAATNASRWVGSRDASAAPSGKTIPYTLQPG
jgi:hypothetical protein